MKRAIILFEGRCGSSHLSTLLDRSPVGTFLGEVLSDLSHQGWGAQKDFLDGFFSAESHPGAAQYVGLKTKLRAVDEAHQDEFARYLVDNEIAVIRLHRRDLLKQTVSSLRADELVRQKGLYNIAQADGFDLGPIVIGPGAMSERAEFIVREELRIDAFLLRHGDIQPRMVLSYEELLADRNGVLARVYDFLGVDYFFPGQDFFRKMTSDRLADSVRNYDQVAAWAEGCKFLCPPPG